MVSAAALRRIRSARHDDDDDRRYSRGRDQGHGGWFGDPEGHAEAARRGWDERERYSSRGRSSGRYEDDNRRSSRNR